MSNHIIISSFSLHSLRSDPANFSIPLSVDQIKDLLKEEIHNQSLLFSVHISFKND